MKNNKWLQTYLFIWSGQFISMLSSYAVHFAVIIWMSLEHQSAEVLAYAGIAGMLPQAIVGPFAGVFIDRWDRKKVMIFSDAFLALCALVMVFLLKSETVDLIWIYLMLGLRSIGNAFHAPAMQAIAPLIVPKDELLRISGINQMLQSVSSIAGPAIGALAISYLPISQVLYLDVLGAAAAIISLLFVSIPHVQSSSDSSVRMVLLELGDGMRAIRKNKGLNFLFLYAMLVTFFIMPAAIMFPLLTTGHYGGGKWEMSVVEIVWGIGMLIGGTLLSAGRVRTRKVILVNAMHLILGLSFVVCGWMPSSWFIGLILATMLSGIALAVFSAAFTAILQTEVAPQMLGRVFSLYFSMAALPSVVGLIFTGWIAEEIGVPEAFVITGILVMLIGLASFLTPSLLRLGKERVAE